MQDCIQINLTLSQKEFSEFWNLNLQDASKSAVAKEWARKLDVDIEYAFALLTAFQKGITHAV